MKSYCFLEENMNRKAFAERLNQELDAIGMPMLEKERIEAFSKLTKTPRFKAAALLNGTGEPDSHLLSQLALEFEVSEDWLAGNQERDKH
jgi:hypothetical protein